ncbi:hypothetical protein PV326_012812 [Microctonus aethiopoides]|nr:hypothetical protein PV326_012812 [Microctonus aethiopoides]
MIGILVAVISLLLMVSSHGKISDRYCVNSRDISWYPKTTSLICSAHFINNKKSEEVLSPSYVPTKFSSTRNNQKNNIEIYAINRHERFMRRRSHSTNKQKYNYNHPVEITASNDYFDNIVNDNESMEIQENLNHRKVDQACQVSIIFRDKSSDAEVQTDIYAGDIVVIPSQKMNKNKKCGTPHKEFVDASVGPDSVLSRFKSDDENYLFICLIW